MVMKEVLTKGNVIVNNITVGDVHYEYQYDVGVKVTVTTAPTRNPDGTWVWEAKDKNDNTIKYSVHEDYSHYGPNLYDYEAYQVKYML